MKANFIRSFMFFSIALCCHAFVLNAQKTATKRVSPPALATVPFQYAQSLIFVKAKINGSRTMYLFLINTGANTTVIDTRTADMLKLPVIREEDTVEGTAGTENVRLHTIKSIDIDKASVKNMEITSRDLSNFVTLNGQKIDGILGTDFLKNFSVTIDFYQKTMAFTNMRAPVGRQKTMPFKIVDGIPRFSVRLNDTFDTYLTYNSAVSMEPSRNNYINVSYSQWQELKRLTPYMNHSNFVAGKGVGGSVYMQVVKISGLRVCELDLNSPYMVVQTKEGYFKRDDAVGFFGNNILEKQRKVTIDFLGERIVLQSMFNPASRSKKPVKRRPIPYFTSY
ncbi:retropepsin-like aspartic protease [Polluticoccus soli]|uniref:retropepsin-like aspartic protease n=1 Tax=Polluticoccus soli TaxID=3034150 RepID=UPI0023E2A8AB|nr:retropepsin-like aspartic protease [Flavipsychrobacter sp. JY13-12]